MRVLIRLTGITLTDDRDPELPGNYVARFEYLNNDGSPKFEPDDDDDDDHGPLRRRRPARTRGRLHIEHDQALELAPFLFQTMCLELTMAPPASSTTAPPASSTTAPASSTEPPPASSTETALASSTEEQRQRAGVYQPRNPGPVFARAYSDSANLPDVPDSPQIIADGRTFPAKPDKG